MRDLETGRDNEQQDAEMPKITYIEHNGTRHTVDVPEGLTVMEGAVSNNIPGIDADCGGACSCATCHVFVDEDWFGRVGKIEHWEESMLGLTPDRQPNSRLACQIKLSDALNGLVVTTPEFQY